MRENADQNNSEYGHLVRRVTDQKPRKNFLILVLVYDVEWSLRFQKFCSQNNAADTKVTYLLGETFFSYHIVYYA